jgi:FRG domain
LERFIVDDVLELRKAFSGIVPHKFNIDDPLDYAAFLNLAQHHGYPTPLLDWTLSPYVAAFFAYRNLRGEVRKTDKIRIYKFSHYSWNIMVPQFSTIFPTLPQVSMLDALAIGNPRAIPQQSLSMITNMDDIETHVTGVEKARNSIFLEAIDLPASARAEVMRDLAFMGITAGSLFPGLDGVCESLREKNFS